MRIAITGASGFLGGMLLPLLRRAGHDVTRLVRWREPADAPDAAYWRPSEGLIDADALEGHDAFIHLAGENLFGVWTPKKKRKIRESRVEGTDLLASTLAALERPPRVLLSASAIGYYGDRDPDRPIDESAPPGEGFMAEVVTDWEAATAPAERAGIRVVRMRTGLVLSGRGGVLDAMLPAFKLGLGGRIGSGRQPWPWVAIDDYIAATLHVLRDDAISGPVNFVAPDPTTNAEFTRALGRVLRRPTLLILPSPAAKLLPGGMGREMLLSGARVVPEKLLASGFRFAYPELEPALRHVLRTTPHSSV